MSTGTDIEQLAVSAGMRMTEQRRVIAQVLTQSDDHPDVEEVHRRSVLKDAGISIATVYRTVRLFEEAGILTRHDFGDGRARYEPASDDHHDHLIDIQSGQVIECACPGFYLSPWCWARFSFWSCLPPRASGTLSRCFITAV